MQQIEEEEYGGAQALMGEGLPPSIGLFVVRFCLLHLQLPLRKPFSHYMDQHIQLDVQKYAGFPDMSISVLCTLGSGAGDKIACAERNLAGWWRHGRSFTCISVPCSLSGL